MSDHCGCGHGSCRECFPTGEVPPEFDGYAPPVEAHYAGACEPRSCPYCKVLAELERKFADGIRWPAELGGEGGGGGEGS